MFETAGSETKCGELGDILAHLTDVSSDERCLIESAAMKIRFEPNISTITIIMDLPAVLTDESLTKIEIAAVKAIPGMRIKVERVLVNNINAPRDPDHPAAVHVDIIDILPAWDQIVGDVKIKSPASVAWLLVSRVEIEDRRDNSVGFPGTLKILCANALAVKRLREMKCERIFAEVVRARTGLEYSCEFANGDLELPPPSPPALESRPVNVERSSARRILMGSERSVKGPIVALRDVVAPAKRILIEAEIFGIGIREVRQGRDGRKKLITMTATDYTDSIRVKLLDPPVQLLSIRDGEYVRIAGRVEPDKFERDELTLSPTDIVLVERAVRVDTAEEKRVELNLHTKFSRLNGMIDIEALVGRVKEWGWSGFAVTDDAVVQSFPRIYQAAKKAGIKAGLGCQVHYVDDLKPIAWNFDALTGASSAKKLSKLSLGLPTVVFDLETTGLGALSNKVIEIAAYRVEKNMITKEFKTMVNPGEPLSDIIKKITHISDDMLVNAPSWPEALSAFREFIGDAFLVAHNISFDAGFLRREWPKGAARGRNLSAFPVLIDTLGLSRALLQGLRNYTLGTVAKALAIPLIDAHRAADDARALAKIYIELRSRLKARGVERLDELNALLPEAEAKKIPSQEVVLLVKEQSGLKNLYDLVTGSHLNHLHLRPRTPASFLEAHRKGLLVGSGATDGPVANALLGGEDPALIDELARRFDYLEIGPPGIYGEKLADSVLRSPEEVCWFIKEMIAIGRRTGRPVVAVSKAHHLEEREHKCRKILKGARSENIPSLHLRTTDEMLQELSFLGPDLAREVVIAAPKKILESLEDISPLPKGFFPPVIDGAAEELREVTMRNARGYFQMTEGAPLPDIIAASIEKELSAIIGNGFSVLYLIAMRLCESSRKNGFVVGSRGSVGSSLVAFLTGITEVNPLPPHYRCVKCRKTEFADVLGGNVRDFERAACGPDLAQRQCCGEAMVRDGYRIPFEAFMGVDGTKVPDIDLNFAGEYQARAMAEIEETFGKDHVFRAGTINTLKEKNAAGYVLKFIEEHSLSWRRAEIDRFARGITEVSRTTGQHPGGIVIIPRDKEITDFMPVQRPADSESAESITTHFDFHSYEGTVVKVDVLGHDCPTAVRMLLEMTGIDPMSIPIDDPQVLSLFSSPKALGLSESRLGYPVGTLAIPEFGTPLLLNILTETRPTTIEELIRISGLSHGEGVWKGNAQDLIRSGAAKLSEVIATREDIMNELVKRGMDPVQAFAIMEKVRKGKGLSPEDDSLMKKRRVPDWVNESCRKIRYMFPRAHAVAYVLMALRIAWFKVYRPEAFYATYFSLKVSDFNLDIALQGEKAVAKAVAEIRRNSSAGMSRTGSSGGAMEKKSTAKEESSAVVLDVVREMNARGIELLPVKIGESDVHKFRPITEAAKAVRAPLLAVEGLGEKVARKVAEELSTGTAGKIDTIEDLVSRTGLSRPLVERLRRYRAFGDLPESNQMTLF